MVAPQALTDAENHPPDDIDPLRNPERRRRAALASTIDFAQGPSIDSRVIVAAAEAIAPFVEQAHRDHPERFPRIRSDEWLDAPDSVKIATLLACGVAWLVADPHRVVRDALKQVSNDIHGGNHEFWRRTAANHLPYEVLRARREGAA